MTQPVPHGDHAVTAAHGFGPRALHARGVVRVHVGLPVLRDLVRGGGLAGELVPAAVEKVDRAVAVGDHHEDRQRVGEPALCLDGVG
jgi:predicted GNAT family acetyltransferase